MTAKSRLRAEERDFFSLVNQAVLANPFSDERVQIDLQIAGLFPEASREQAIKQTIQEVQKRVAQLGKDGRENINHFSGQDRQLLMTSYLFLVFHEFIDQFDALINDQLVSGANPVKVAFTGEALAFLRKRGFTHSETLHFFALCFQLRRAFYFIHNQLVGRSDCMKKLRKSLWNNVFTCDLDLYNQYLWSRMEDFSTLILGETGAGKGAAARAIGLSGHIPFDEKKGCFEESFTKALISLNLSQFSENLIESELFGHKKGAFTGAVDDHKGIFDRCSPHGAIFLDEIGEVSTPVQIKLLRVLEERSFSPVGCHEEHRFKGRIIAATNREILQLQTTPVFRSDFFYRLCSDMIMVPPLRQRLKEDPLEMDDLLDFTVEKIVGKPSPELVKMVRKAISHQLGDDYSWPGNVREIGQCVRRILLNGTYSGVARPKPSSKGMKIDIAGGSATAQDLLKEYCRLLYDLHGTYGEVARITQLDRRTVKKYIS